MSKNYEILIAILELDRLEFMEASGGSCLFNTALQGNGLFEARLAQVACLVPSDDWRGSDNMQTVQEYENLANSLEKQEDKNQNEQSWSCEFDLDR